MIIQLKQNINESQFGELNKTLKALNITYYPVKTQKGSYYICTTEGEFDLRRIGGLSCVADVHRVNSPHKMVSQKWKVEKTVIDFGDGVTIGNSHFTTIAGPCSIESEEQVEKTVEILQNNGIRFMRGGVYKPRTSPYSFRGLGIEGLKMFSDAAHRHNIKVVTEVMEPSQIEQMEPYVDVFQVGSRNSQNFNLLEALGEVDKPVLIKRGISGSIDELLYSAEYVFKNGNEKLILCERGIRTFEKAYRNTLDLNAIPILKEKSHLPVIVDPSHGIGIRRHVSQMTLAGVAAGADGVIIEIHEKPNRAATDGQQTIDFREFGQLVQKVAAMRALLD